MTFGPAGTDGSRIHNPEEVSKLLEVFAETGETELDTARMYCQGKTEEVAEKKKEINKI